MSRPIENMRYWRIIRYYFQVKYSITQQELETLMFICGERYFDYGTFSKFGVTYKLDRKLIDKFIDKGWIILWKERTNFNGGNIYAPTKRAKLVINQLYDILNGELLIPEVEEENPLFAPYERKKKKFTETKYQKMIMRMNEEMRSKKRGEIRPIRKPRKP